MLLSLVCLTEQILKVSFQIYGDTTVQKKEHKNIDSNFCPFARHTPTCMYTMQVVCVFSSLLGFTVLHKKTHSKFFSSRRDVG